MKGSINQPKVFISYSWTNPQHEQWVLNFAERLSGDGILVVIDKWDLKEGQDKHVFMEKMVNDREINKVLVICDSGYKIKADGRKGGVGTETQLISKEVYENVDQEKFIPIVKEYDSESKPCIPHFMASRIYIDLSSDEIFEENYRKLIRNLYNKPLLQKPSLGTPPAYITEEEQIILKTSHKVIEIKNAILNDRKSTDGLISDYLDTFLSSLDDFRLSGGSLSDFDEKVLASIEKMLPFRDDFIEFTYIVFKYKEDIDLGRFHDFFEKLITFKFEPENIKTCAEVDCDNYRFFIYELFLYFISILLQLKKYKETAFFINSQYFYRYQNYGQLQNDGVGIFNSHVPSLDVNRNQRLKLQRISVTADLIKSRATRKDISFAQIVQTDLILYYLTELKDDRYEWTPRTSVYNDRGAKIELFERMISIQHFEKIKVLFDVESVENLKEEITKYIERNKGQKRGLWDYTVIPLENILDLNKIGTVK